MNWEKALDWGMILLCVCLGVIETFKGSILGLALIVCATNSLRIIKLERKH